MCTQITQSVGFMRDKMIQFPGNESDALQMCFFFPNQPVAIEWFRLFVFIFSFRFHQQRLI